MQNGFKQSLSNSKLWSAERRANFSKWGRTPLGIGVLSASAGSLVLFALNYATREGALKLELESTKRQLEKTDEDNKFMRTELYRRSAKTEDILEDKQRLQEQLLRCENRNHALKYAYANTNWCLFRHHVPDAPEHRGSEVSDKLSRKS